MLFLKCIDWFVGVCLTHDMSVKPAWLLPRSVRRKTSAKPSWLQICLEITNVETEGGGLMRNATVIIAWLITLEVQVIFDIILVLQASEFFLFYFLYVHDSLRLLLLLFCFVFSTFLIDSICVCFYQIEKCSSCSSMCMISCNPLHFEPSETM